MSGEIYSPMYVSVTDIRIIRANRIREAMLDEGVDQQELASRVGVTQGTISLILTAKTKDSRHYPAIARELKVNLPWIMGDTDQKISTKDAISRVSPEELDRKRADRTAEGQLSYRAGAKLKANPDTVELHEFDISYGLGGTYIHDVPVTGTKREFSRAFIRHFTQSPFEYLFFGKGNGTSMMPTILDNDIVLIDTYDKTPKMSDQFWALEMGGMGMIKRLRPTKDGNGVRICSDNGLPEDIAYDGEMQVVGRVVGIFRKT